MVKRRKLAVPYTSVFICQLSERTQNIIRKDIETYAEEHGFSLLLDEKTNDYIAMSRRFCDINEIYNETTLEFCKEGEDVEEELR